MSGIELSAHHIWYPFKAFGLTGNFWRLNMGTIAHTWIVLLIIAALIIVGRWGLRNRLGIVRHMLVLFVRSFRDLVTQSMGEFDFRYFSLIISLFTFILLCNLIPVVPWFEEPTSDINTTLALGITGFLFTQIWGIRAHGIFGYIKHFFKPFAFMLPLNIIEKIASVVSLSFRLFGNIFGGMIISKLYLSFLGFPTTLAGRTVVETFGIISGVNFILIFFFVLFEGFIQAFVFSMLSLTYLTLTVKGEE